MVVMTTTLMIWVSKHSLRPRLLLMRKMADKDMAEESLLLTLSR